MLYFNKPVHFASMHETKCDAASITALTAPILVFLAIIILKLWECCNLSNITVTPDWTRWGGFPCIHRNTYYREFQLAPCLLPSPISLSSAPPALSRRSRWRKDDFSKGASERKAMDKQLLSQSRSVFVKTLRVCVRWRERERTCGSLCELCQPCA